MLKNIQNYIQKQDWFGYKIRLNFNEGGSTNKTVLGGIVSILIKLFILGYIILVVKKMILHEEDRIYYSRGKNAEIDTQSVDFEKDT